MKRTILLHDDNWADYMPNDYAEQLVEELKAADPAIVANAIEPDAKVVTRLLAWIGLQSGLHPEFRFEISRHDAVVLLEAIAGCPW